MTQESKQTDQDFPYICYEGSSPYEWGIQHGETFRQGIKELALIREELMLQKNPKIRPMLDQLAAEQYEVSKAFAPNLITELDGIIAGSGLTKTQLVILNNYTDFRDIQLPDEGCSTIHINHKGNVLSGQTWDMHGSAKKYVCLIHVPETEQSPEAVFFSLVGCLGMMGINSYQNLLGVNNINTRNARAGVIWPVLVRRVLEEKNLKDMRYVLTHAPVTSGHNYILSDKSGGEHWEITPEFQDNIAKLEVQNDGAIFHTNHCLGENVKTVEETLSVNSTTNIRYELLEKKAGNVHSFDELIELLTDHENYPKSICSHFQSGAQDPSFTCGGGAMSIQDNTYQFWRGCPKEDQNYKEYKFQLVAKEDKKTFIKV